VSGVQITSLVKTFGPSRAAIQDVTLTIEEGSIFALVGGNGAGKTTLLKILATLVRPTSGHAIVHGYDTIRQGAEVRRLVGYVPDSFGLYGDLKVWEYLEFFADCFGLKQASATITELLTLVDLYDERRAYIASLSRGMRQRLLLARALIHDPEVLLLDEPASGLDPQGRQDILEVLRELSKLGKTIVVSTHLLGDVSRMCSDVAVLESGRLLLTGPTADLVEEIQAPRRIRIEVVTDPDLARLALGAVSAVRDVHVDDQTVLFTFDGSRYELPSLLERLIAQEVKVVSFGEEQGRLEALLGHLLYRGRQEEAITA
jgi:ABC-2 type transport system ATP-binding protein